MYTANGKTLSNLYNEWKDPVESIQQMKDPVESKQ